jgi:IS5 family transposase
MRKHTIAQRLLFDQAIDALRSVFKPEKKLTALDKIITDNPGLVQAIHADITQQVRKTGREGISAERILRTAVIKQWKNYSYRELAEQMHGSVLLRWFSRFYSEPIPHYTALQKAIKAIGAPTWQKINELLITYAAGKKIETGTKLRIDTTVVETNIAYPLDARLLWDSIRVLTRIMEAALPVLPGVQFNFAKRTKRAKKLCYTIVMAKGPHAQRTRQKFYRQLLRVAREVVAMASTCHEHLLHTTLTPVGSLHEALARYLPCARHAIAQCERRVLNGETVPAAQKIVSLFEEHTDIIKRGKSHCPTEFGHKVLFATGATGLITQYAVFRGNPADNTMLPDILRIHCQHYGAAPDSLAGDRRFFSADNETLATTRGVKNLCIAKPGYRSAARQEFERQPWFRRLKRFRAGIEGVISTLLRRFGLTRCLWKGWESFRSYVGLSVVTFNLQKIAALI